MASPVEHFMMPRKVEWYYDEAHDAIVVAAITTTYMLLHLGRLDNVAKVRPAFAPGDLLESSQPPPSLPEYKLMLEVGPIPKTKPLPEYILYQSRTYIS